jgi:hypothetical protein
LVAHTCNPNIPGAEYKDCKLEASLSYLTRSHLKKKKKRERKKKKKETLLLK